MSILANEPVIIELELLLLFISSVIETKISILDSTFCEFSTSTPSVMTMMKPRSTIFEARIM